MPSLLSWRLRTKTLAAGRIPRLMGVVNVTPDSFSDGGRFFEPAAAVEHGLRLAAEGADAAGYRRPKHAARGRAGRGRGRTPPRAAGSRRLERADRRADFDRHIQREGRRRVPCRRGGGNQRHHRADLRQPSWWPWRSRVVAASAPCIFKARRRRCSSIRSMATWWKTCSPGWPRVATPSWRPGLPGTAWPSIRGSASARPRHTIWPCCGNCRGFATLGCPLMIGVSRKAFIGHVIGDAAADRTAGTIGAALAAARQGVEVLRVHDVAAVRQALLVFEATGGLADRP